MKKWYKKPVTKAILLLLAHVMAVTTVLSLVMLTSFSSTSGFADSGKTYEDSASFKNMIYSTSWEVMESITLKNNFETDGKYDPKRLVDVMSWGKVSGENEHGLAYELQDLVSWSAEYMNEGADYIESNIVVCESAEGKYHYYYMNEFQALVNDGELKLEVDDMDASEFMRRLQDGAYTSGYYGNVEVKNAKGETQYVDCWTFNEMLKEKYPPVGASNILEVVNNTPELNGKLSKVYGNMQNILSAISSQVDQYLFSSDTWDEGNTNMTYMFVDESTKKVYTNNSHFKDYDSVKENLEQMKTGSNTKYLIVKPKLAEFETNMDSSAGEWRSMVKHYDDNQRVDCIFAASVNTAFPIQDSFYSDAQSYNLYAPFLKMASVCSILCSIIFLIILIWMTLIAGRCGTDEEVHLNAFDRWKTELGAAFSFLLWFLPAMFISGIWGFNSITSNVSYTVDNIYPQTFSRVYEYSNGANLNVAELIFIGVAAAFTTACFLFGYLSLVRRVKAKTIWKNSILRSLYLFLKEFWQNRTITLRTGAVILVFLMIHFLLIMTDGNGVFIIALLIADVAGAIYIIKNAISKMRISTGIREIESGNVDYQISLTGLKGENLKMAEMVNHIGNGLQKAVEEGMKNERLKTDLITNVSHDIKTPLTSIINYVDILKRGKLDDPKVKEYLDILETKAQRLKTLTEDVVEASKVSSGNIVLDLMDVDLVEMINQTDGEFTEKFGAKELVVVQNLPKEPAVIHVDGRRMWRVLENVYNNAAKYAMPKTRVYADLWVSDDRVGFSLKNISEQPLNISADELTERFIRGDISRGTEGSGLGLSIAKSLTAMQGGEFKLYLDGDLFKVTIEFPRVR